MMNEPLVSVVIPIYNVEPWLDRCVASVAEQTYRNLEIILVDDGSPDNCPAICDAWARKDPRIRVIHKKNAGLGMARNTGMDAATGEYICFFDSDDYVLPTILEKCLKNAMENGSDAVIFGRWDVYEDGRTVCQPISGGKCRFDGREIREQLLPGMFTYERGFGVSAWGRLYRLESLRCRGLRFRSEREIISEDAWFALEFYGEAQTVTVLPENLYCYRKRETSLSRSYRRDRQDRNDDFLKQSLDYIRTHGLPEAVAAHLTARYHSYTIAALKQTMAAPLSGEEKAHQTEAILSSPILRSSLDFRVLRLEKASLRLFFTALKLRQAWLCRLLLRHKMRSS